MRDGLKISQYIDGLAPRVSELQNLAARPEAAAGRAPLSLLTESLEHLGTAMEELRVTEEEMRAHLEAYEASRAHLERELYAARDRFDLLPEPCLVTDAAGSIRAANHAAGELLGMRPAELAHKPLAVFVPEGDRRAFRTRLKELAQARRIGAWRLRLVPRRGLVVEVEASVSAGDAGAGEPTAFWTLRAPQPGGEGGESGDELEMARLMVRSAPVAMAALDVDGTVLVWNRAAERLLGWSEESVVGRRNPALDGDGEEPLSPLALARRRPPLDRVEAEARRHDGSRLRLALTASPLVDGAGTVRGSMVVMEEVAAAAPAPAAPGAAPAGRRWSPGDARRVLVAGGGEFVDRLRRGIAAGLNLGYLRPGDRLPSIREAAQAAGVDHRVVATAYRWLAAEGLVEVRNRHGVMVAEPAAPPAPALGETAEWLVGVLGEAWAHQVKVGQLPELLRRWTASARVRCACVESCQDHLVALAHELRHQWGLDTFPVALPKGASPGHAGEGLPEALRAADLVVTTPFHAGTIRAAAEALGKPVVVVHAHPELVAAVEERLRQGPLTAVVADAEYAERLRAVAGGENLRVVLADDGEAVAALDPSEPVLLTRAAQQRTAARLRLLVPVSPFVSPAAAGDIARVLVARNVAAERTLEA